MNTYIASDGKTYPVPAGQYLASDGKLYPITAQPIVRKKMGRKAKLVLFSVGVSTVILILIGMLVPAPVNNTDDANTTATTVTEVESPWANENKGFDNKKDAKPNNTKPCTTTNFGAYGKVTVYHLGQSDEFVVPGGPSAPVCNP